jgi:hypothetical protein
MDAPNMTQQVPERQRKRKLPQVSLQDNFNPIDLIKSQETLALFTHLFSFVLEGKIYLSIIYHNGLRSYKFHHFLLHLCQDQAKEFENVDRCCNCK